MLRGDTLDNNSARADSTMNGIECWIEGSRCPSVVDTVQVTAGEPAIYPLHGI
jgi:hypothetical protein